MMISSTSLRSQLSILKLRSTLCCYRHVSSSASQPLRILFCGTDNFSIESLKALHHEKAVNPSLIKSIDVVCKTGKRHGRGLKNIREAPIVAAAKKLSLPLHQLETFTKWQCPEPGGELINLVLAVSFGLLIPSRIINGAHYGGLNLHPSLLPDFRGAAPLHWTLLSKCSKTGITLQTLHPFHFDRGKILLQTPLPGIDIPNPDLITPEELTAFLAPKGAELLVRGLRDGVHRSEETTTIGLGFERPAPKITPEDRHINWNSWTAEEILRRHRVIGPLWSKASTRCPPLLSEKRIVWSSGFQPSSMALEGAVPGSATISASDPHVYIRTIDQQTLRAESLTVEGQAHHTASSAVKRADMVDLRTKYNIGSIESIKLWTPFS